MDSIKVDDTFLIFKGENLMSINKFKEDGMFNYEVYDRNIHEYIKKFNSINNVDVLHKHIKVMMKYFLKSYLISLKIYFKSLIKKYFNF
jgi:hypothetical protein